jgi:hypothetical protein
MDLWRGLDRPGMAGRGRDWRGLAGHGSKIMKKEGKNPWEKLEGVRN